MTTLVDPDAVGGLSDAEWLALLDRSLTQTEIDGLRFPLFPDDQTQMNFVGASRHDALVEALRFVRYALDALAATGGLPPAQCSVIDFGCGWGRITRTLLRDFRPEMVVGVDPIDSMVQGCRQWFAPSAVRFETVDSWPPLSQDTASVDLIVAYSVFSHLPERLATAWIAEFRRVLKPGGIVVATTQSRSFIEYCDRMRNDTSASNPDFLWHQLLANSFTDTEAAYRDFDTGHFLHAPTGAGAALSESVYGESLFSGSYVANRWSHLLSFVCFEDKPNHLPQAVFALQKPRQETVIAVSHDFDRIHALQNEITDLRSSESWRIGQAVLAPVRMLRRVQDRFRRRAELAAIGGGVGTR